MSEVFFVYFMQILPDVPTAKQCFCVICPGFGRLQ